MAGKKRSPGFVLTVIGGIFLAAALGVLLGLLGLMETEHEYGAGYLVLYSAIGGALVYAGRRRAAGAREKAASDGPLQDSSDVTAPSGDMRRLTDRALDAADGLGVDTSGARAALRDLSVEETSDHLSAGGGDEDNPLIVSKLVGKTINVRFWRLRGRPDFELDLDVETGEVTFAKADGERLV